MAGGRIYSDVITVGDTSVYSGSSSPDGSQSATRGSLFADDRSPPQLWQNTDGASAWDRVGVHVDAIVDAGGGGTHSTIEAALADNAVTIFVRKGTYTPAAALILPDGCRLVGEDPLRTIVDFNDTLGRNIQILGGASTEDIYDGAGTITVTDGSAVVAGLGTTFQTAGRPVVGGDWLMIFGVPYQVETVDSDLQLTLTTTYLGVNAGGVVAGDYLLLPMARDLLIRGFTFRNYNINGANPLIAIDQVLRGRVEDCILTDTPTSTGGRAVEMMTCADVVVENCQFREDSSGTPVGIQGGWRCGVRNSQLFSAGSNGVVIQSVTAPIPSDDHFVESCAIGGNGGATSNGISVNAAATVTRRLRVVGCVIQNVGQHGITCPTQTSSDPEHLFQGNIIRNPASSGIQSGAVALISGNLIEGATLRGIRVESGGAATIRGNTILRCDEGIQVDGGMSTYHIVGNDIRDSVTGAYTAATFDAGGILKDNVLDGNAGENDNGNVNIETLGADKTLTMASPRYQVLDGNGVLRNVDLPNAIRGIVFRVRNSGGVANLDVRAPGPVVVASVTPGTVAEFANDGTTWAQV